MNQPIAFASAPLGHHLMGVDIAAGVSDAQFAAIDAAFNRYGVIVLRNQRLTPEQHIAFGRRFGPTERYGIASYLLPGHPEIFVVSNIIEDGKPIGMADAGRAWHSDMCYVTNPPRCSLLYALEVPRESNGEPLGDTCFASTQAAYDALPYDMKQRIEGLKVRNSYAASVERKARLKRDRGGEFSQEERQKVHEKFPDVLHPLVRTHPVTGRKCLYVSEGLSAAIDGLERSESDELIAELLAHMMKPEFVYRHRWCEGDLVMWDNCSSIHIAISDFSPEQRRRMHRTTILNESSAVPGVFA
ncbi:TauD/TfdA family dioxygenase [Paraburkholderia phymatum]|uniref:TauD/TfdA dioxygenase family protein n=1 Tax=Paraburkholderia phymatum TaxID=148447 RepID=UPI003181CEED